MQKKDVSSLEKNLDSLGETLLVIGGAALGTYAVKRFLEWYRKNSVPNENPTYYFGAGDADLGFMPVNTKYGRR